MSGSQASGRGWAGVVLAGGLSRRMGQDKALALLDGRPLVARALAVLERGGAAPLAISANGDPARFAAFGVPILADEDPGRPGPLAGLAAALDFARDSGRECVATIPVDTPFLPPSIHDRLAGALRPGDLAAVAATHDGTQPLVAVWRSGAADPVRAALAEGRRAVRDLLAAIPHAEVTFSGPGDADDFANLNTPEDLARAEARLAGTGQRPEKALP